MRHDRRIIYGSLILAGIALSIGIVIVASWSQSGSARAVDQLSTDWNLEVFQYRASPPNSFVHTIQTYQRGAPMGREIGFSRYSTAPPGFEPLQWLPTEMQLRFQLGQEFWSHSLVSRDFSLVRAFSAAGRDSTYRSPPQYIGTDFDGNYFVQPVFTDSSPMLWGQGILLKLPAGGGEMIDEGPVYRLSDTSCLKMARSDRYSRPSMTSHLMFWKQGRRHLIDLPLNDPDSLIPHMWVDYDPKQGALFSQDFRVYASTKEVEFIPQLVVFAQGRRTVLPIRGFFAQWLHDGQILFVSEKGDLSICRVDGRDAEVLYRHTGVGNSFRILAPRLSPNRTIAAYVVKSSVVVLDLGRKECVEIRLPGTVVDAALTAP
jgi:hypothetical protein